jgi:hypothetical protein
MTNLFFNFCSDLNLFKFAICSYSTFVHTKNFCSQAKFVQIQNLFKFEICSYSKFVQIQILFKFKICSNLVLFIIQKLFISKNCSYPNLFQIHSNFDQILFTIQILFRKRGRRQATDQSPDLQMHPLF